MEYKEEIEQIITLFNDLKNTSKTNEKLALLMLNKDSRLLKELAKATYNDDKYFVTLNQIPDHLIEKAGIGESEESLFDLLNKLKNREITGYAAINAVDLHCRLCMDAPLLLVALDHNFGCGVSKGLISKVFPDIFNTFSVALAEKYDDKTAKTVDFSKDPWIASRKLDGVRCICIKKDGEAHFYARSGKEFFTLDKLKKSIEDMTNDNFVLDGEMCIVNENGDEDFISIVSEIKRKNWTIENPCYQIFDCLTLEEFYNHTGILRHTERMSRSAINEISKGVKYTTIVEQHPISTTKDFDYWVEQAAANGWEGIMIRKDIGYEGKRSKNMLKVKKFQDAEFKILDCENDIMRLVEDGRQVEKNVLARILIEYKGNIVSVGGGFSKEQRVYYADRHDKLIGKTVTIKYFQESINADGKYSLRFPTVKYIYEEERDC